MAQRNFWLRCSAGLAFGAWFLPALAQVGSPASLSPVEVDRRIVLKIGAHEVSAYALEKNLLRFRGGRSPDAVSGAALKAWGRLFLAQQVILAQAVEEGYLARPEVTAMVERMEAHMLTQTEGPFYATLVPQELDETELAEVRARLRNVRHVAAARFRDETEADRVLGADFCTLPVPEKRVSLRRAGARPGVAWHEGPLAWPYDPFPELGDALENVAAGRWFHGPAGGDGFYVAEVQRIETRPRPELEEDGERLAEFVRLVRKTQAQRAHCVRTLREAEFAVDDTVLARLAERLRDKPLASDRAEIPAAAVAPLARATLFSYQHGGGRERVSVAAFADHFNQRFVRPQVLELDTLRQSAADMAMSRLDLMAARARGLDREPRFEEDRKNFRNYQALDWFEKERLRPELAIDDAAVAARYEAQRTRFTQATRARVRRLEFADAADAARFLDRHRGAGEGPAVKPRADAAVEIARGTPLAGLEFITEPLLRDAPGATFGPLQHGERTVVLLREETLDEETATLAAVAPMLRQELERAALDAKEIALAPEMAARFAVEDRIDYARYGLDPAGVAPWAR